MDGFHMSVIDSDEMPLAYCDDKEKEELLMEYAEDHDRPTRTVYSFVPHEVVHEVIMKHGGKTDDLTI
jgi:hypothetical protein